MKPSPERKVQDVTDALTQTIEAASTFIRCAINTWETIKEARGKQDVPTVKDQSGGIGYAADIPAVNYSPVKRKGPWG